MNFSQKDKKHFVLLGPPNSGKTTLFNWLTGFKHRVVNYPGSTVLLSVGDVLKKYKLPRSVTDTPGIYSLFPHSEDEKATQQFLFKNKETSVLILVLDASKLEIQLPLFFQLKEAGFPLVVALTMGDILPKPARIDISILKKLLKSPVVPIKGLMGEGVPELVGELEKLELQTSGIY